MIFVFDLDGTLCDTQGMKYHEAKPRMRMIERVNELYDAGHFIKIDTARGSGTGHDWWYVTRKQLEDWGVKYHELRCGVKMPADKYVDDRAVNAEDWLAEEEDTAA